VKPSPFDYVKPASLGEALKLLSDSDGEVVVLAGGQSLMPTLNMRLSSPSLLIDINGITELDGIEVVEDVIRIGALTRHQVVQSSADIAQHAPLIAMAMPHIAHPAIRNRGTFGGSIALADPAAELPACLCALGATIEIAGNKGRRVVSAIDFFKDLYETDLSDDELLTAVEIPTLADGYKSAFEELARRHGDYAMTGLAAHGLIDGDKVSDLRLAFFAVGGTPVLAKNASAVAEGRSVDDAMLSAVQSALEKDLDPFDDLNCSAAVKMLYAKELTSRALKAFIR
jgi:carbon-monoxide dehydrogenase medium subunit